MAKKAEAKKPAEKTKAAKKPEKNAKTAPPPSKRAKLADDEYAPLAPYLRVNAGKKAIEFYKTAFKAKVRQLMEADDKKRIMHASLIINGGELMLSDEFPEMGAAATTAPGKETTVSLHLQVDNADKWWARAMEAGAKEVMPLADQFWGDRFGMLRDPFGHVWSIASASKRKK